MYICIKLSLYVDSSLVKVNAVIGHILIFPQQYGILLGKHRNMKLTSRSPDFANTG